MLLYETMTTSGMHRRPLYILFLYCFWKILILVRLWT